MGNKNGTRYSKELKKQTIAEYEKKELGYIKIAKKFGMTRDTVRGIGYLKKPTKVFSRYP